MTKEQFIHLVKTTQGALRRFLVALCCGDTALADDIAQEAYIKAFLSIDELRDTARFGPWLNSIAYRQFLNCSRSAHPTVGLADAPEPAAGERADGSFEYQELYRALAELPPKERSSLLLFYIEGYQVKEISEITGISQDAVRQHLTRGRNHLRSILKTNDYDR